MFMVPLTALTSLTSAELEEECPSTVSLLPMARLATSSPQEILDSRATPLPIDGFMKGRGGTLHLLRSCSSLARGSRGVYSRVVQMQYVGERNLCRPCMSRLASEMPDHPVLVWMSAFTVARGLRTAEHSRDAIASGGRLHPSAASELVALRAEAQRLAAADRQGLATDLVKQAVSLCDELQASENLRESALEHQRASVLRSALLSYRNTQGVAAGTPSSQVGRVAHASRRNVPLLVDFAEDAYRDFIHAVRHGKIVGTGDVTASVRAWLAQKAQPVFTAGPPSVDCLPPTLRFKEGTFGDVVGWMKAEWRAAFTDYLDEVADHWAKILMSAAADPGPDVRVNCRVVDDETGSLLVMELLAPFGFEKTGNRVSAVVPATVAGAVTGITDRATISALHREDAALLTTALSMFAPANGHANTTLAEAFATARLVCAPIAS